jgi:CheY-like chemotaxis protein/HPt (histidine-containing phosphotransfer) domain-containing protein
VLVVGDTGRVLSDVLLAVKAAGLEPVQADGPPTQLKAQLDRDGTRYLASVLVMEPAEGAKLVRDTIGDQADAPCPWVAISQQCDATQRRMLFNSGCVAVLEGPFDSAALQLSLTALRNRLDAPDLRMPTYSRTATTRPLKILLADDNVSNQMLLARILSGAGHSVVCAERGGQAFDIMASEVLDVAILDLNMPDMSGPDVVKLYRASSIGATGRLPIMILSADATPAAKQESLEAGADEFLTKPVVAASLFSALARLVGGESSVAPKGDRPVQAATAIDTHTGSPGPTMVDSDRIQSLRRIARGDEKFLEKYISAAFSEIEQAISDLRKAVTAEDVRGARDALHIIEGTGASVGATALVANCKSMRHYLGTGHDSDSAHALAELSTAYTLAKSVILANMHNARENVSRSNASR